MQVCEVCKNYTYKNGKKYIYNGKEAQFSLILAFLEKCSI